MTRPAPDSCGPARETAAAVWDIQGVGEFELLAKLRERLPPPGPRVRLGSGDDAAVTVPGGATATSVDAIVDGVHFRRADAEPAQIGAKALATALSDLAAMGAEPGEAYVVAGVPEEVAEDEFLALLDGILALAAATGTTLAGGDVVRAPALTLAVTVVGHAAARRAARHPRRRRARRLARAHRRDRRRRRRPAAARAARARRRPRPGDRRPPAPAPARAGAAAAQRPRPGAGRGAGDDRPQRRARRRRRPRRRGERRLPADRGGQPAAGQGRRRGRRRRRPRPARARRLAAAKTTSCWRRSRPSG